jgi:dTDP-4-amino-4,6-dideoxygalactose transaminase
MRPDLLERAEGIREKGTNRSQFSRGQVDKYTWVDIGSSFLPGELVASFLYGQLQEADKVLARRLSIFDQYNDAFADLAGSGRVARPVVPSDTTGNGHMYYLMLRNRADRDSFIKHMQDEGINTPFHYVPLHSAPAGLKYARFEGQSLPVTDDVSARLVRLPMFFELGDDISKVITSARSYLC